MISKVNKNIIANYIGKAWGFISVYVFVPFYIDLLGIESYAVINFFTVLMAILFVADAGLTATLNREVARAKDGYYISRLLFTIEKIYWGICFTVSVLVIFFSPYIASYWLNSESISIEVLSNCISLMGVCVALLLLTSLYNGVLLGMQEQVQSNVIQIVYSIVRSGLVILLLYYYPSLYFYFGWYLLTTLLFVLYIRYKVWKKIGKYPHTTFDFSILKNIYRFALGMMFMAILSSLNVQIDKLLSSKLLSLEMYGYYSLASIMAQSPLIFTMPIVVAILPNLTFLSEHKDKDKLKIMFHTYAQIITTISAIIVFILIFYTPDIVLLWTHTKNIADTINVPTKLLLLGNIFLTFQFMPYYLSIANGYNKINIILGIITLIMTIPILYILIRKFGIIGAAIPWIIMNFITLVISAYILINKFLKGEFIYWLIKDIIIPIGVCLFISAAIYKITLPLPKGYYVLLYSFFIFILSISIVVFQSKYLKQEFLRFKIRI